MIVRTRRWDEVPSSSHRITGLCRSTDVSAALDVPELPFPVIGSHPGVWRRDAQSGAVIADAPAHTDFYVNPAGEDSADAESMLNAATLLGTPPAGDFQLSARVTVDFQAQYDAGVLLLWIDEQNWAKFCFEFSPAAEPMVVSVVTRGVSDDANAFTVPDRSVWLRVSRIDRVYAYHASTDGKTWTMVRVFSLGEPVTGHQVGFEAQSPTGDGCTVTFDDVHFTRQRLADLRDGS
jgi:regulation of enolase protein 1 (concanavalin A-like superfamily)